MIEIKRQVKEGFEDDFNNLMAKKESLQAKKEEAIRIAIEEVDKKYSETEDLIKALLDMISDEVKIEVPDPVQETEEDVANICEALEEAEVETEAIPENGEPVEANSSVTNESFIRL